MNHEEATIKAFILSVRQERYLEFLKSPKKRAKFIAQLAHFKHLDPKCIVHVPGNQQNPSSLLKLLVGKGAGSKCWVISENSELDGQEMDLQTALKGLKRPWDTKWVLSFPAFPGNWLTLKTKKVATFWSVETFGKRTRLKKRRVRR